MCVSMYPSYRLSYQRISRQSAAHQGTTTKNIIATHDDPCIASHGFLSRKISILRTQDDDVLPIERKYSSDFSCNFIQTESTNYDLE